MQARCMSEELLRVCMCVCAGFIEFNSALALKVEEKKLSEISNFALRYDPRTVGWLTQNVCLSHRNRRNGGLFLQSLLCLSVSLSVLPSAVCLDWTYPDEGDFPGKVIWKEKKRLNSKSMFHYISFPLCVWCVCVCTFYEWSSFLAHWRHCVFPPLIIRRATSMKLWLPVHTGARQGI